MKKLLIPFALLLYLTGIAQPLQHERLSYLNEDGNPIQEENAVIIRQVVQLNDTLWETNLYTKKGPRIMSLRSRDATGKGFNGSYRTYRTDGWADTLGFYRDGKADGRWLVFAARRVAFQLQYEEGRLLWRKDSVQLKREKDSTDAANPADTVTRGDSPAIYPGGQRGWLSFLNHTLRYPDEAVNNNIMGMVVTAFTVDTDGMIVPTSLQVQRSIALSLDREALRVISQSGAWVPAVHVGRNVKTETAQPIIFRLLAH
jgi:TonB family protein